jgi:hypothetical protein
VLAAVAAQQWCRLQQRNGGSAAAAAAVASLAAEAETWRECGVGGGGSAAAAWAVAVQRSVDSAAAAAVASLAGWLELSKYKQDLWKVLFEVLPSFLRRHHTDWLSDGLPAKVMAEQES